VFGDLIHRALADYYIPETMKRRRRGPHPAGSFLKYYDEIVEHGKELGLRVPRDDQRWRDARELGEEMMTNYIDTYGKDLQYVVLYPEMPFAIDIYDHDNRYLVTWVGVSDAFIYDIGRGEYGLFEHKTAATISTGHLFLDEQASTYWTLIPRWLEENEILRPGMKMGFMLYNCMRKAKKDERPVNEDGHYLNKDGTVSKNQPPPLFKREIVLRGPHDREAAYDRIVAQATEMNMARTGDLEVYKAPGKDCKSCQFRDMCELHESGADWKEFARLTMVSGKRDPYAQHVWAL